MSKKAEGQEEQEEKTAEQKGQEVFASDLSQEVSALITNRYMALGGTVPSKEAMDKIREAINALGEK